MNWRKGLAMDLGTANTLIHKHGEGIVLNEPSVVAINNVTGEIIAVGEKAKSYIGRTPENIRTVRPLKDGVINDYDVAQAMIKSYLRKISKRGLFSKPPLIICVPSGITQVERRAVLEAADESGMGRLLMMEEPMAAAIGAGCDVSTPEGKLVVDIGGGTTEVALISMYSTIIKESLRVAGDEMDQAIADYVEDQYGLYIGMNQAEQIKIAIGSAVPQSPPKIFEVHGKNRADGSPKSVKLRDGEAREALEGSLSAMEGLLVKVVSALPPEFISDIGDTGVTLAGGGAMLTGLAERLTKSSGFTVRLDREPLLTVVHGAGIALEDVRKYQEVFIN